ncbi:ion transporter [Agromyces aurantiacus]|uniref:Ion transporter n=1 Tax=Agromyces aurantiacus TaxID=165814 RepID=A0ABV9R735_9MICO|nr:ion transporter [Agromyces aurantiacus]MBM7503981.1 voltage-gated potassium channel [Agromyces aurantiacus]
MARKRSELKSTGYEIFIGALSVLSIVNLVLMYVVEDDALDTVLALMNGLCSVIFLIDFVYRLATAPQRGAYFFRHYGWADLLASLPLAQVKILRVFRLVRVYRLLADLGPRTVLRTLIRDRAGSALYALLIMGVLVLEFGSLIMLAVEQDAPDANITSGSDAVWYTMVTISTVGYGDRYPVTDFGRVIGGVIIVIGVGIFGTFTGYLANLFLAPRKAAEPEEAEAVEEPAGAPVEAVREQAPALDEAVEAVPPGARAEEPEAVLAEVRALLTRSEADLVTIRALLGPPDADSGRRPTGGPA